MSPFPAEQWTKSSRSADSDCVEVRRCRSSEVLIRDSKDPSGPVLTVSVESWARFVRYLRTGGGSSQS
jgi:hypothetical protein